MEPRGSSVSWNRMLLCDLRGSQRDPVSWRDMWEKGDRQEVVVGALRRPTQLLARGVSRHDAGCKEPLEDLAGVLIRAGSALQGIWAPLQWLGKDRLNGMSCREKTRGSRCYRTDQN